MLVLSRPHWQRGWLPVATLLVLLRVVNGAARLLPNRLCRRLIAALLAAAGPLPVRSQAQSLQACADFAVLACNLH